MRGGRLALGAAVIALSVGALLTESHASVAPIVGFGLLHTGPDGGTAWQGVIPEAVASRELGRASIVYLPPGFSATRRYPVVYILHGLPGSAYSVVDGMRFTDIADRLIATRTIRPLIAVMPAGPAPRYGGEWGGPWERYVVDDVVPWSEAHLPIEGFAAGRTLAGYSAGGFGAVDIGLRHPTLFSTLESWSGYFEPPHDGPFRHATLASLNAHDPTLLAEYKAASLRSRNVRFYLSVGSTRDRWTEARTLAFASELQSLRLRHSLWLAPGGHDGRFWRLQLPAALEFAVGRPVAD
jgi:enterochelin esterase-like enzyme